MRKGTLKGKCPSNAQESKTMQRGQQLQTVDDKNQKSQPNTQEKKTEIQEKGLIHIGNPYLNVPQQQYRQSSVSLQRDTSSPTRQYQGTSKPS
jgi:hypothetical protein